MAAIRGYRTAMVFWRGALIALDAPAAAAAMAAVVLMRPVSGWWVWCLAGLLALPLAVRRRWPVPVLVVVALTSAAAILIGVGAEVSVYAVAFALYPVAASSARVAAWGLAGALGSILVPGVVDAFTAGLPIVPTRPDTESFSTEPVTVTAYSILVIAGTWALACAVRVRRRHATELAALRTARAVAEERLRIARDVHDSVGHNLSLIAMKAAVANHLGNEREAALHMIEKVSRAALDDIRAVLDGLREHDLDGLVEQTRAAGVNVTIDQGDLSPVPAGVRESVYRIVQEALTNVRRHARATLCEVTIVVAPDTLMLSIVDNGPTPSDPHPSGHGLRGMRERVAAHGGSLSAGPQPAGGFAVRATLPLAA
jgi:signal transduction histidine kinase